MENFEFSSQFSRPVIFEGKETDLFVLKIRGSTVPALEQKVQNLESLTERLENFGK